jgi:hypothetical protein
MSFTGIAITQACLLINRLRVEPTAHYLELIATV